MRRPLRTLAVAGAALALVAAGATPAFAGQGKVVVFSNELTALTVYQDPTGCNQLPRLAHVIDNETVSSIRIYTDPLCLTPSLTIAPGYGSHVSGVGSFSA